MDRQYYNYNLATLCTWGGGGGGGGGDTQWRSKDRRRRQRQTDRQSASECKWETDRQADRQQQQTKTKKEREKSKSKTERERKRERKHKQTCSAHIMLQNGMKHHTQSQSMFTFYFINKYQRMILYLIIKPNFHSVSLFTVIFHRATGSSNLVVYSKQYTISV